MQHKAIVTLSCLALAACGPHPAASSRAAPSAPPSAANAAATAEPVHIETNSTGDRYLTIVQPAIDERTKKQRIAYELRALSSTSDIVGNQSVATLQHAHITFHDRQGKTLIADSPQAKLTQQDKNVFMTGGVRARADDGSVLTCDTLRYDGRTEKLHGQGHVILSAPNDLTLTGNYLEGDVRLDDVRVAQEPI